MQSIFSFFKKHNLIFLIMVLLSMCLVLYARYIFSGKIFLFEDFGSDSVRVSLPTYIYFFDWFRNGMPLWSDKMGIGTSILSHGDIIFDPFTYILYIFGRNSIVNMFVYMVIAKIIFSGIFFWAFLGKFKLSSYAKVIGAVTYAFGGYMIVTGQNYVFGTIYVYLPLILLGFEMWLQDKKGWLLILTLTLTALYFYYFFYMTAVFFFVYSVFRYFSFYSYKPIRFLKYLLSLAWFGIIAMGLSAFYWLPSVALTLSNLRVGASSLSPWNMLKINPNMMVDVFGRLFGYDIFGNVSTYFGFGGNYFQLVTFCGILTLVLTPQIFCEQDKRKRRSYGIFLITIAILLFVPFFSYVFNGFSDFTYRWTYILPFSLSLFLALAVDIVYEKMRVNYMILFITAGLLIAILMIEIFSLSIMDPGGIITFSNLHLFSPNIRHAFTANFKLFYPDYFLIAAFVLLTVIFLKTNCKNAAKIIILILVCISSIWFPYNAVNNRLITDPNPVRYEFGYFDGTNQTVSYLNKIDSGIYRIDKSYDSVMSEYGRIPSDNDAMAQGYRGLKSYNGNNQPNYIRFLQNEGIFVKYPAFIPLKGVKPQDLNGQHLNYINGVGDRYLLQSFLGVKYYLVKSDNKVILPSYYAYLTTINNIDVYRNNYYLPLGFAFDNYITNDDFMKLDIPTKDLTILSSVVIDGPRELREISNNPNAKSDIVNSIKKLKERGFKIISYKDDNIVGQINSLKNEVLVFTIPYDQGWEISVDSRRTIPLKVDNGLIGIKLSYGLHVIRLHYFPPEMTPGIIITALTLLLFLFFKKNSIIKSILRGKREIVLFYDKKVKEIYMQAIRKATDVFKKQFKKNLKKSIFYTGIILGILIFFISGFITRGHSFYNFFNPDRNGPFMDFFNVLRNLFDGPYTHNSIYPPLPLLIYKLMLHFVPYDIAGKQPAVIRATQAGEVIFLIYMLITLLFFLGLTMLVKKGTSIEKYVFSFIMLFSAPFLHQFERANIIFVSLLCLMIFVFYKDSKNRILRELALIFLAVSAAIKIYPAVFGLLLIKEKKYKDAIKVFIYCVCFFILPFFILGGIKQFPLFIRNLSFASYLLAKWGVGYAVSMQNITRIIFGFFGNFGDNPIVIGKILSLVVLIFGLVSAFFLRTKWKAITMLTLIVVLVPSISYEYVLIFMIIPLIMFLDKVNKERFDYAYLTLFILLFIPFSLGRVDSISNGFGKNLIFPLTYGILIQNIAILIMAICLIIQGLGEEGAKIAFRTAGKYLSSVFGLKSNSLKEWVLLIVKVLLAVIIFLLIFGDDLFSLIYNRPKTNLPVPQIAKQDLKNNYPFILGVQPYYVHFGDKILINGGNFIKWPNNPARFFTVYGKINTDYCSEVECVFSVPLNWKFGQVKIGMQGFSAKNNNFVEIDVLDRLGNFNLDDIKYFGQIKYLTSQTQDINNFTNYKLRNIKFSRFIPTRIFQVYADTVELIDKIKIIHN